MCPRKNRTLKQWKKLWGVWLLSYIFYEVWLICFRMIHNWNSSNRASLSSIVFKIECQKPFVPLSGTSCRQGNCYNRSPMWPSIGFKPFATKKQHGFVYMMILDNHLNNSQSFSSCVPSHYHWHKSTVALLNIVWFCARCSQMPSPNKKTLSKCQRADRNSHSSARFKSNSSPIHVLIMQCW